MIVKFLVFAVVVVVAVVVEQHCYGGGGGWYFVGSYNERDPAFLSSKKA